MSAGLRVDGWLWSSKNGHLHTRVRHYIVYHQLLGGSAPKPPRYFLKGNVMVLPDRGTGWGADDRQG